MRTVRSERQPGGCLGCLGLSLIVLVVLGVLAADQWLLQPHVGPYPATLRSGEREQQGRISVLCWPGVREGSDDNDPCPSWCDLLDQTRCVPDNVLVVSGDGPLELDFARTGIPAALTYRFFAAADLSRPLLVLRATDTGAERVQLPADGLAPGDYLLHVTAEFGFGPEHSQSSGTYDQGFHISIP